MKGLSLLTTLQVALLVVQNPAGSFAYASAERRMELKQMLYSPADLETFALKTQVPFEVRDWSKVSFLLKEYASLGVKVRRAMKKRMATYLPAIANTLRENGLPEALQYLPLAESRLFPAIGSPAGAKGIWQFMPATARKYGLQVNGAVDEREDPVKSTQAAVKMLRDLHDEFGDWMLVIAAYNCGPSKVRRAIQKSNCNNYWDIDHLLPSQTRTYVPAFVAAACYAGYLKIRSETLQVPFKMPVYAADNRKFWQTPLSVSLLVSQLKKQEWGPQRSRFYLSELINT